MLNSLSNFNLTVLMRSRQNLVSAIALGIAAAILLMLATNQISGAIETNRKLATEQQAIEQLEIKARALEQIKFSAEFAQADRINEVLPSKKPLLELLNNLNNVATETRISITDFVVNPGEIATDSTQLSPEAIARNLKKNTDYDRLNLELSVVGELSQVRRFMDLIERVSPITTITSLIIDRKVTGNFSAENNITRAKLALSAYYYTKSISATISAPLPIIAKDQSDIFQEILDFTPAGLDEQTSIISGGQSNLFGIDGLTVQSLEEVLQIEESTNSTGSTENN